MTVLLLPPQRWRPYLPQRPLLHTFRLSKCCSPTSPSRVLLLSAILSSGRVAAGRVFLDTCWPKTQDSPLRIQTYLRQCCRHQCLCFASPLLPPFRRRRWRRKIPINRLLRTHYRGHQWPATDYDVLRTLLVPPWFKVFLQHLVQNPCTKEFIVNSTGSSTLQMAAIEPVEWPPSSLTSGARARYRQGELLGFPCVSAFSYVGLQDYIYLLPRRTPLLISFFTLAYPFGCLF